MNFSLYDDAKQSVIENLTHYGDLMRRGIPSTYDRVPSTTTSLIRVDTNQAHPIDLGEKVTLAVTEEFCDIDLVRRYTAIINSLQELEKEVIIYYYVDKLSINQIMNGIHCNAVSHPLTYLERAYTDIAILDESIEFDLKDYIEWKKKNNKSPTILSGQKRFVDLYLNNYFLKNGTEDTIIRKAIEKIPEPELSWLKKYINKDKPNFTTNQYRKVLRAKLAFMYLCEYFSFSTNDLIQNLERTGNGYAEFYRKILKNAERVHEWQ